MTTHALAAKHIRQELKKIFPLVKFSVTSQTYSGGNSVHIGWMNGPTSDEVGKVVYKYQYGSFDSMRDCYEYTNTNDNIPQVKYVQVRRDVCETIQNQVFEILQKTYAHFDKVVSIDESSVELLNHWSVWTARNYIYRLLVNEDLTHGYKKVG